ncbi:MAG: isoleucine--tRNA ligase, partial [Clostridiales bacterium]|nr:isoleucine--tRNA ligase [Clostridiales bacterium]
NVDPNAPESVHLCDFPASDAKYIDTDLEKYMDRVLKHVVLGRACRNTANIKNRQPIARMYIKDSIELPELYKEIIEEELNVKEIVFTQDASQFTTYKFKPQLKTLGPRYGKLVAAIGRALLEVDGNAVMAGFMKGEKLCMQVEGTDVELAETDVLTETARKEGFVSESDRDVTVVLDINLTPELIEEGFVREIISKVQTMRKEADFEVQDNIILYYGDNENIVGIMERNGGMIAADVLAVELRKGNGEGYTKEWNINGENATFTVQKAN